MRKLKKRLAALGIGMTVLAASVMSMSASAVSTVTWPGGFTPNTGGFYATSTVVSVRDLRWSLSQVLSFNPPLNPTQEINGVEFEFRPQPDDIARPNGTHDIWARTTDQVSNLPVFYCEFQPDDYDDVAVCCGDLRVLSSSTTYYGHMFMEKKPSFTIAHLPYTFESEYGTWAGIPSVVMQDYLPIYSGPLVKTKSEKFIVNQEFPNSYELYRTPSQEQPRIPPRQPPAKRVALTGWVWLVQWRRRRDGDVCYDSHRPFAAFAQPAKPSLSRSAVGDAKQL